MLSQEMIKRVEDKVIECYLSAQNIWSKDFELPLLIYKDMGRTAGRASYKENRITLSPTLLSQNFDTFLKRTIPHECCHLFTHKLFPNAKRSHGPEWKNVMQRLGVQDITRCHSYDTSAVARSTDKYIYTCKCNKRFEFGTVKHKRFQSGVKYWCLSCKTLWYTKRKLVE